MSRFETCSGSGCCCHRDRGTAPCALILRTAQRPRYSTNSPDAESFTCLAMVCLISRRRRDLEEREETNSLLSIGLMFSPSSSETQSTVMVKPSTVNGACCWVVINSLISDFCNRAIATSARDRATRRRCRALHSSSATPPPRSRSGGFGQVIDRISAAFPFTDQILHFVSVALLRCLATIARLRA